MCPMASGQEGNQEIPQPKRESGNLEHVLEVMDRDRALERLMELLTISAPTGEEGPVRDYLLTVLFEMGLSPDSIRIDDASSRIEMPCQTGNLIVQIPGSAPGSRRMLVAHMDTVPLAKNAEPVLHDDRIVAMGRTALGGDNRAGIAAILSALDEVLKQGLPHPPLTVLFTMREESGLQGARAVRAEELGHPELAFNFDGGNPEELTIGATGAMRMQFEIRGLASHAGSHPERGISAVSIFARAADELDRNGWLGLIERPEGRGTSNIGAVHGGEATNVVTDRLVANAEARSHNPEFLRRIVDEYQRVFTEAAVSRKNEAGQSGEVYIHIDEAYSSFVLPEDSEVVRVAMEAALKAGLKPRTRISNGGLDANWLVRHSIPTVSLGCGQHEIHTTAEYLLIEEFHAACRLAMALALG